MNTASVTLRLLDKADKEILKLPRTVKGALYDFQHKFKANPQATGLQLKQLKQPTGAGKLWSARVNDEYRALLLRLGDNDWLIVSVKHRKEAYDRLAYGINQITGGIEYVDLEVVEDSVLRRTAPTQPTPAPRPQQPTELPRPEPLFARFTDQQLTDLGVAEPLVPVVRTLTTEEQLLGLVEYAPQLTGEILLSLFDGKSYEDVLDQVTAPVAAPEPVDTEDFQAAAERPATMVTTTDDALREALEGEDFGRWKVFLHPTQSKLVERDHSGPARVGGGPGTGKTIVALHRVKHLVEQLPRAVTSLYSSRRTTRTSQPTFVRVCWSSAANNCCPAWRSATSTNSPCAWSGKPSPGVPSRRSTTTRCCASGAPCSTSSVRRTGTRNSFTTSGRR